MRGIIVPMNRNNIVEDIWPQILTEINQYIQIYVAYFSSLKYVYCEQLSAKLSDSFHRQKIVISKAPNDSIPCIVYSPRRTLAVL